MARVNDPPAVALAFGERVRARRMKQGLSQIELAHRAELHFTYVSSIERGERNPTLTSVCKIAQGLHMDPSLLVKGLRVPTSQEP